MLGQILDDGDLHTQRGIKISELAADGTRSHDDHRFGQFGRVSSACFEEITCSPSMGMNGISRGPCSGGEDDVVGFVLRAVHVDPAVSFQFCEAVDQLHVVLFEQEQHAFVHRFGHAARAGYDLFRGWAALRLRSRVRNVRPTCNSCKPGRSCSSALVGMQPQLRHTPPASARSTSSHLLYPVEQRGWRPRNRPDRCRSTMISYFIFFVCVY